MQLAQLAVSPCANPDVELDALLTDYARIGFRKFEVFTSWARSAFDYRANPDFYLAKGRACGMSFSSMHLPRIESDVSEGVRQAVQATRFARAIGVSVVIFKAASRENYIAAARPYLDAVAGLGVVPAIQNHVGTPISTLEDYRSVLAGIADPRMKTVLEVGMFCSVGVSWRQACDALGESIVLVHLKDQIGERRVPFGSGEADFAGLFRHLDGEGYRGDYVVEMEVERADRQKTLRLLADARTYLAQFCKDQLA